MGKTFGGTGKEYGMGLSVDKQENITVGGFFRGPLAIDNYLLDTPGLGGDSYIAKFNLTGSLSWARYISGTDEKSVYDLVEDNGKLLVIGYFFMVRLTSVIPQ